MARPPVRPLILQLSLNILPFFMTPYNHQVKIALIRILIVNEITVLALILSFVVRNKCQGQECAYMCLPNEQNFTCFCQYGKPTADDLACKKDSRIYISSMSLDEQKRTNNREKGTITGVVISLVAVIIILFVYYYYQQLKINRRKKNDMRFVRRRFHEKRVTSNLFLVFLIILFTIDIAVFIFKILPTMKKMKFRIHSIVWYRLYHLVNTNTSIQ